MSYAPNLNRPGSDRSGFSPVARLAQTAMFESRSAPCSDTANQQRGGNLLGFIHFSLNFANGGGNLPPGAVHFQMKWDFRWHRSNLAT
jgi:hypothetical protein